MDEYFDSNMESWCICLHGISKTHIVDKLKCNCGEDQNIFEWTWEDSLSTNVVLSNQNRDALFHPIYSSGTAAVKGNQPLQQNTDHYWEIKILTNLYGTDFMVGVGTSRIEVSDWKLRFSSMLGDNTESWGYSYKGKIQHNRLQCTYGSQFTIGSLIGVHVDMSAGTIEYYLNRQPLGVAFRNLKNYELYPMICSTAAQSAMRITCSLSHTPTLQMKCLKVIVKNPKLLKHLRNMPGVMRMVTKKYFWLIPATSNKSSNIYLSQFSSNQKCAVSLDLEDECVLSSDTLNKHFQDCKQFCLSAAQPRADPDHMSYRCYLAMQST